MYERTACTPAGTALDVHFTVRLYTVQWKREIFVYVHCLNCKREGHCARDCVIVAFLSTGKMGHSSSHPAVAFGVLRDVVRHHIVGPLQGH